MKSGIIFDFDGTIALSEQVHMQAWKDLAKEYSRDLPADFDERGIGLTDRELAKEVALLWQDPALEPVLLSAKKRNYQSRCREEAILVPGVAAAVARLARRYPLGIATSANLADIQPTMERFGLHPHFRAIATIESVVNAKPHPEIYLNVAAQLGIEPSMSFAFEDSPAGAEAARSAGLHVIGLTTSFPAGRIGAVLASIPDFVDFSGIEALLISMNER